MAMSKALVAEAVKAIGTNVKVDYEDPVTRASIETCVLHVVACLCVHQFGESIFDKLTDLEVESLIVVELRWLINKRFTSINGVISGRLRFVAIYWIIARGPMSDAETGPLCLKRSKGRSTVAIRSPIQTRCMMLSKAR